MSIGGGARFRLDGRTPGQMRPVNVQMDVQKWATASLIWQQGDTHVLCSATLEDRTPPPPPPPPPPPHSSSLCRLS